MIIFEWTWAVPKHILSVFVLVTAIFTVEVRVPEELPQHFELFDVLEIEN
jgi:uncharacterized membrane protein